MTTDQEGVNRSKCNNCFWSENCCDAGKGGCDLCDDFTPLTENDEETVDTMREQFFKENLIKQALDEQEYGEGDKDYGNILSKGRQQENCGVYIVEIIAPLLSGK